MKLTFLGTSAAEQYPGIWCTCDYCNRARKLGGRNIRRTSSVHFAKNCMIDFPPEVFSQARNCGIDLLPVSLLLVTHSHEDHFYPQLFYWRYMPDEGAGLSKEERNERAYCRQQELPTLHMFGSQRAYETLLRFLHGKKMENFALDFTVVEPYKEYEREGVKFVPMIGSHMDSDGQRGLIYIVEAQGKTFLYAVDSGPYTEETRACIAQHKYDAIIMEQTGGYAESKDGMHMTWKTAMNEMKFFEEAGIWKQEPHIYWTHMSPHKTPPHTDLEQLLQDTPITPAYDGMEIDI